VARRSARGGGGGRIPAARHRDLPARVERDRAWRDRESNGHRRGDGRPRSPPVRRRDGSGASQDLAPRPRGPRRGGPERSPPSYRERGRFPRGRHEPSVRCANRPVRRAVRAGAREPLRAAAHTRSVRSSRVGCGSCAHSASCGDMSKSLVCRRWAISFRLEEKGDPGRARARLTGDHVARGSLSRLARRHVNDL
jgi:hypothetical protein